jgi:hypothetical protein
MRSRPRIDEPCDLWDRFLLFDIFFSRPLDKKCQVHLRSDWGLVQGNLEDRKTRCFVIERNEDGQSRRPGPSRFDRLFVALMMKFFFKFMSFISIRIWLSTRSLAPPASPSPPPQALESSPICRKTLYKERSTDVCFDSP